jgi:hypothetical protein
MIKSASSDSGLVCRGHRLNRIAGMTDGSATKWAPQGDAAAETRPVARATQRSGD